MDERLCVLDLCHCFGFRTAQLISGCKLPNNGTSCRVVERTLEGARQWTAATERGKGARQFWPRSSVREGVTGDTDVGATASASATRSRTDRSSVCLTGVEAMRMESIWAFGEIGR